MGDPALAQDFAEDIVLLKTVGINPVVVHGGGPQIGRMLKALGIESRFVNGLRVTDKATAEVAEMVLSGAINKELVSWISKAGGKAVGISGKDGAMVTARKVTTQKDGKAITDPDSGESLVVDLGYVGEPDKIDTGILDTLSHAGLIPVIAPIAVGPDGETYNINADTMAGAIAAALGAARLFLLTDVPGVLDKDKNLLTDLTPADIAVLAQDGTISGGMIPKLETCTLAVEAGCEAAVVLDGRVPHAMLLEFFTSRGAGTLIRKG
jgi:acetylglutamate kinase